MTEGDRSRDELIRVLTAGEEHKVAIAEVKLSFSSSALGSWLAVPLSTPLNENEERKKHTLLPFRRETESSLFQATHRMRRASKILAPSSSPSALTQSEAANCSFFSSLP